MPDLDETEKCLIREERYEELAEYLQKRNLPPGSNDGYYDIDKNRVYSCYDQAANKCFEEGNYHKAAILFEKASQGGELRWAWMHMHAGDCFLRCGEQEKAINNFIEAWIECGAGKYLNKDDFRSLDVSDQSLFEYLKENGILEPFIETGRKKRPLELAECLIRSRSVANMVDQQMIGEIYLDAVPHIKYESQKEEIARCLIAAGYYETAADLLIPLKGSDTQAVVPCFVKICMYEKAAKFLSGRIDSDDQRGFEQAAKLFHKANSITNTNDMYIKAGREARARRLSGEQIFKMEEDEFLLDKKETFDFEAKLLEKIYYDELRELLIRHEYEMAANFITEKIKGYRPPTKTICGNAYLYSHNEKLFLRFLAWTHKLAGDKDSYLKTLRERERLFREEGRWFVIANEYKDEELYEEMERLCKEEGELCFAAMAYERDGYQEKAARIYEEMAGEQSKEISKTIIPSDRKCPSCGASIESQDNFCKKCGYSLTPTCAGCGKELQEPDKFCPGCGRKVE